MIKLVNVYKYFNKGKKSEVRAIDNTSIDLPEKGIVTLLGPSGCGKTTLLNSIGGLSKIDKGSIYVDNEKITKVSVNKIDKIRSLKIGYIFQNFNLLDDETVFDNVSLVLKINGLKDKEEIKRRVNFCLESLGIYRYRNRYAGMLSGGERQRVAIARAIVKDPEVIIADEPTGNLDSKNTIEVMNIIKSLSRDRLVILVTHEKELAKFYSDRIIEINDGNIVKDYINQDNHELDYKLDNKVYLKDIKNHETIKGENVNIDYYVEDGSKLNLKIVVKNDNIYIESDKPKKIENISNSNIELVDAHYEKINKRVYEEFSFDYSKVKNDKFKSKYSSIYNIFSGTKRGLMKILNYSFIKKLLLVGFFMSSMFIMYSVSSIMGTFNIKEKDFVNYNKNYLLLTKNNMTKSEYDKISNMNNVNYAIPTDGMVTLNFKFGNYLQTSGVMQTINGNLASSSLVDKIISGTKIKNNNEIIIDKLVIDKFLSMSDAKNAGYLTYDSFIKESVYLKDGQEYKIVGISDTSSPSIYASDSELINIIDNFINDDYLMEETTSYKDYKRVNASLTSGRYPVNDYEVIVSEFNKYDYPLNKEIDNKIGNTRLKVVGYYKSNETSDFLVSENTIKNKLIFNSNNFVISSKDKKSVINELKSEKYNVVDTYENSLSTYKKNLKDANKSKIMYSSVIVVISLIEMYLIIRSSFLSRVKEVGILRSIGIKRKDIYKMFMGEILSITLISSVPGLLFMSYVLYTLSKIEVLNILINPLVFIISLLIVVFFNLIFGLLPVYRIVKKTPHEILSRNDVD
mgnify:FL=1